MHNLQDPFIEKNYGLSGNCVGEFDVKKRNYGIDLLRVLSIIGVMVLHILGHGGVLANTEVLTMNYSIAWLLEVCAYCAVDCFVIISGFVGIQSKLKYSNLANLWLETELYSVAIMAAFTMFGIKDVKECITAFFPLTTSQYWFFTMYFGMMLFTPILNTFIEKTEWKDIARILLSIIILYTVLSIFNDNIFELKSGYSVLWFIILYICGAFLNKIKRMHQFNLKLVKVIISALVIFTWLSKLLLESITLKVTGQVKWGNIFIKYTSPTILAIAIGLVIVFSEIKCKKIIPFLERVTQLVFSAYLLQDNKYVRGYLIKNKFSFLAESNTGMMVIGVVGSAIICFCIGLCVDMIRVYVFYKLKIKERLQIIEKKCLKDVAL